MNEERNLKGFLSDYKCYVSYLKDMIGGTDFLTFAEFCNSQEREELRDFGVEYAEDDSEIVGTGEVSKFKLHRQVLEEAARRWCNQDSAYLDNAPDWFAEGMGWHEDPT